MNDTEVMTGLAAFLQGLYVHGYEVIGTDKSIWLFSIKDDRLVSALSFNRELGLWISSDIRTELKDVHKER
jgi:hypothetical protein